MTAICRLRAMANSDLSGRALSPTARGLLKWKRLL